MKVKRRELNRKGLGKDRDRNIEIYVKYIKSKHISKKKKQFLEYKSSVFSVFCIAYLTGNNLKISTSLKLFLKKLL